MLLSVYTISAVPPVQTFIATENSLTLKYPTQQILKVNETHDLEIHIFNSSTGYPLTTGVTCTLHLYNSTGKHVWEETKSTFSHTYDIGFTISGTNFTQLGSMAYIIQCNSSTAGGFVDIPLEITYTGTELTTARALLNLGFLTLLILLFIADLLFFLSMDTSNRTNAEGEIVDINNLKYFKGVLFAFGYALLIAVFFTASNIALAFLGNNMFGQVLFVIYRILFLMALPMVVIWFIWIFVSIFQDREFKKMIDRGVGFKGGDI